MASKKMAGGRDDEELPVMSLEGISVYLAEYTLEGKWKMVEKMYKKYPQAHTTMINDTVGTALHVAVDMHEQGVVAVLVKEITKEQQHRPRALQMKNEHGDTPLHVAASRGFANICKCIIEEGKKQRTYLLSLYNNNGESPLFVAAINWQKQAFAYLSSISRDIVTLQDLKRDNGDTILHCAIQREYFDLAVIIVHYHDFLILHRNKDGFTPLMMLATRPSAFPSGSSHAWWKQILYHCVSVQPLDAEKAMVSNLKKMTRKRKDQTIVPKNYTTCYEVVSRFWKVVAPFENLCSSGNITKSRTGKPGKPDDKGKDQRDPENPPSKQNRTDGILPPNYATSYQFFRSAYVHILGLTGVGLKTVQKTKKKHKWSVQLLNALMKKPYEAFTGSGGQPTTDDDQWGFKADEVVSVYRQWQWKKEAPGETSMSDIMESPAVPPATPQNDSKEGTPPYRSDSKKEIDKKETAFLIAARNGIVEMVEKILSLIPSAVHNTNSKKENVLLVAVANKQPLIVQTLKTKTKTEVWSNLILGVDEDENTILHLAAQTLIEEKPWQIPGFFMQMVWDIKWFQYIRSIVPQHFRFRNNKVGKTAVEIFKKSREELVQQSSEWLKDTSESCSVVAGLIAGVSFATASTVPGGTVENGRPTLLGQPAFDAFAIASLIGLCFSVTALIMFLSILTSRKQAKDFRRDLPLKLLLGLSSLFISIAAMFVSFCTGHFFVLKDKYRNVLFPIYAATCLPVSFYAVAQFPLYTDLLSAILTKVPQSSSYGGSL